MHYYRPQLTWMFFFSLAFFLFFSCEEEDLQRNQEPRVITPGSLSIKLIEDEFEGKPIVLVGSRGRDFIVAFDQLFEGEIREFTPVQKSLPVIMEDSRGNRWDIFGKAVAGPDKGKFLTKISSGMGFWFAFSSFWPGVELYAGPDVDVEITADTTPNWRVSTDYVAQGAGFDGIPSIQDPEFTRFRIIDSDPSAGFYLEDDDLVMIVYCNGEIKIYPHAILDWHEVINDKIGEVPITVTYCPLTATGKVWKREGPGIDKTFGVSGFLYNSNLIAFDRETETLWSQITASAIFGNRIGDDLETIGYVETRWSVARQMFDQPLVMTENTGYDRDYKEYPYGNYPETNLLSYPILFMDSRLPLKERVFAVIIGSQAKIYQLSDF